MHKTKLQVVLSKRSQKINTKMTRSTRNSLCTPPGLIIPALKISRSLSRLTLAASGILEKKYITIKYSFIITIHLPRQ